MKTLVTSLLLFSAVTVFAQLEVFDTHTSDTTFNPRHLPTEIIYKNYSGEVVGYKLMSYFNNDSLQSVGTKSDKGFIYYELNERGNLSYEKVKHYSRVPSNNYYIYEYTDLGNVKKLSYLDSNKTLLKIQEYTYNDDETNCTRRKVYNAQKHLQQYTNYTYAVNGEYQYSETFNSQHQLIERSIGASFTDDGYSHAFSYTYNEDNQLTDLMCRTSDDEGETQRFDNIDYQYKRGVLISFNESYEDPVKVKKNKDSIWVEEHAYATNRTKEQQSNNTIGTISD